MGKHEDLVCNHLQSFILDSSEEFTLADGMEEISDAAGAGMED